MNVLIAPCNFPWRRLVVFAATFVGSVGARGADAPAEPVAATPAEPVAPSEWIDPATGHRLVRLGKEPGTASLYFHQNAYSPDGKKMIIVTPEGLAALDLQTRAIDLLAPGVRITMSTSNGIEVSRKEPVVYYSVNNNGQNIVYAMNMDTHVWTQAAVLPPGAVLGGITADDAMLIGIRNIGGRGGAAAAPAAATGGALSNSSTVTLSDGGTLNLSNNALAGRTVGNLTYSGGSLTIGVDPALSANIAGLNAVASNYVRVLGNLTITNGTYDFVGNSPSGSSGSSADVVLFEVNSFDNITGNVNALKWAGQPAGFTSTISNITTASGNHYLVAHIAFTPSPGAVASTTGDVAQPSGAQWFNPAPRGTTATPGRGAGGGGGQSKQIYTIDLKTGETKSFFPSPDNLSHDNLNHFQCSPTDPNLFMFAHEGTWSQVDRIWTMHPDGTGLKLMHVRSMPNEIAGHEFFSHDGKWIYYDLQTPQSDKFWIGGVNVETGEHVRYPVERSQWSVHYNVSWDGKVFSGDGGGPSSVANRRPDGGQFDTPQNGQWLYLFTPAPGQDDTIEVNGEKVKVGKLTVEKLADMSKHVYTNGRGVEPNATFTPDDKWLVFRSDMEGIVNVYAVEIAKASPEIVKQVTAEWDAYNAAVKAADRAKPAAAAPSA